MLEDIWHNSSYHKRSTKESFGVWQRDEAASFPLVMLESVPVTHLQRVVCRTSKMQINHRWCDVGALKTDTTLHVLVQELDFRGCYQNVPNVGFQPTAQLRLQEHALWIVCLGNSL